MVNFYQVYVYKLTVMSLYSRRYYERTNNLIEQYMYIDCLLDSAIPYEILDEYSSALEASAFSVPETIQEEGGQSSSTLSSLDTNGGRINYGTTSQDSTSSPHKTRTPKDIFRSSESMPLLQNQESQDETIVDDDDAPARSSSDSARSGPKPNLPWLEDADLDSNDPVVTLAIWVNMIANLILLAGKLVVVTSVPSLSVLASLVDAVLDFLSTAIVWTTTYLISSSQHDQDRYPVGRRR